MIFLLDISNITFASPWMLLLLLMLPLVAFWFFFHKRDDTAHLNMPKVESIFKSLGWAERLRPSLALMRLFALLFLIIALARPRTVDQVSQMNFNQGVDIMMVVDVSKSMEEIDLRPSRIGALKKVATRFALDRKFDRIGLVAYAGEAFTKIPLTTDRRVLINAIRNLSTEELQFGTAIGNGLGTAVNHLKSSKVKSKVIILLTDGVNNSGFLDPEDAAKIAAKNNIKVYTIGIGSNNVKNYLISADGLDEKLLKKIAQETKGRYFRATSLEDLSHIYKEIDQLEKSKIEIIKYHTYHEFFRAFLLLTFVFIVLELILRLTIYRSFI